MSALWYTGKGTSVPITEYINVVFFKHYSEFITNYITCMEYIFKITYSSTIQEVIVNIISNAHLAIQDSLDSKIIKISAKLKQNASHKLK